MRITSLRYNPTNPINQNHKSKQQSTPAFKCGIIITAKEEKQALMVLSTKGLIIEIGEGLKNTIKVGRRMILCYEKRAKFNAKRMADIYNEISVKGKAGVRFEFVEDEVIDLILPNLYEHWDLN